MKQFGWKWEREGNDVDVVPVALGTKKGSGIGGTKKTGGGLSDSSPTDSAEQSDWTDTKRLINLAKE